MQNYSNRKLNSRITTTVVIAQKRATSGTKQIAAPTKNEFIGKEQTAQLSHHEQSGKKMEEQNTFEKSDDF